MAGYSGTPLARKLGIKESSHVYAENAPGNYRELLAPLPDDVTFARRLSAKTDVVHLFETEALRLSARLTALRKVIRDDATVWISWPKKASKVRTDITEDTIRDMALPMGYVDVKVCAVDETWSGLKLVIRKSERR